MDVRKVRCGSWNWTDLEREKGNKDGWKKEGRKADDNGDCVLQPLRQR